MKTVGFVGGRGMVGSVLLQRMAEEKDFDKITPVFFSTSQVGQKALEISSEAVLLDANNIDQLAQMDIIISCQGSDYTQAIYPSLRKKGWPGYWIDAASALRMNESSIITLDPINKHHIEKGIETGVKEFIGGNCTVSLMLLALAGLFKAELIEWVTAMTYQAASGAGAQNMKELVSQMSYISENSSKEQSKDALTLGAKVNQLLNSESFPKENFKVPLAASLIPWIDTLVEHGQSKEEWKAFAEANKILNRQHNPIPIDGTCVRVGAMRCHSQAFTIKLKKDLPLSDIEALLREDNQWVQLVENSSEETLKKLTPTAVTGTLDIPVGRVRKMNLGPQYLNAFSVGDQLLWGAAEPLRRTMNIILEMK